MTFTGWCNQNSGCRTICPRADISYSEQMRKLLTLNKEGKLSLRAADGLETEVRTSPRNVLLLIDTSGSMAGAKIEQARNGAIDFAHSAITRSYATALAVFADRAAMVCDPTADADIFAKKVARIDTGLVGGTTDLAAGLILAAKFRELAAVVVVTDGQSNDNNAALEVAATLKARGIDIICIGTHCRPNWTGNRSGKVENKGIDLSC